MRTFAEKILNASAGSIVVCEPDVVMSHDDAARIRTLFEQFGGERVCAPSKLLAVLGPKVSGTAGELMREDNSLRHFVA